MAGLRLLALSDVHNHVGAVARLVAHERGQPYDAVLVAGDMGADAAAADLTALRQLGAVYYVYGNWDRALAYPLPGLPEGCTQVHLDVHDLGHGWRLSGYSGCVSGWGPHNPMAQDVRHLRGKDRKAALLAGHNDALARVLQDVDGRRLLVMTHERLTHVTRYGKGGPAVHLHGHLHRYRHTEKDGRHIIDVAGLDGRIGPDGGGYCVLALDGDRVFVERRRLS